MISHRNSVDVLGFYYALDKKHVDPESGKESMRKMYGCHECYDAFLDNLLQVPEGLRHCYEMLIEGTPCCPYLDVEFYADEVDVNYEKFSMVCKEVGRAVMDVYGIKARILAYESSRWDYEKAQYKHSYHMAVSNVVMDRNNSGEMAELMSFGVAEQSEDKAGSLFYYKDKDDDAGQSVYRYMVDMSVYTKIRMMRLLWCSNYKSLVVFQRMMDAS